MSSLRRLDQLLASLGYCSRSEARDWVASGAILVAGEEAKNVSQKVRTYEVSVDGEGLDHPDGVLIALHKPVGLVCSHDGREGPRVYDILPPRWLRRNPQITSIGRLDKETSGLIILTDQNALVHRLTSPKHKVPKLYRATLDRDVSPEVVAKFASGELMLEGEERPCLPAELHLLDSRTAEVILTEGRYHQVRRMFVAAAGATVIKLARERFGDLELGDLPAGQWRELPLDYFDVAR